MGKPKQQENTRYIAGRNAVIETLESKPQSIDKLMLAKGVSGDTARTIRKRASRSDIPVQVVPDNRLDKLSEGANHQGVVAVVAPVDYLEVDVMLQGVAPDLESVKASKPLVVVLDRIEDPYNYGAILRSVVGCGAAGVIVPARNMAPVNAHTIKASAGTALRIPIARSSNVARTLESMKERGYWVVGADGTGDTSVWEMDWDRAVALVIGNEHAGLSTAAKAVCDYTVAIPVPGDIESLNASVAAGILLFAARGRQ